MDAELRELCERLRERELESAEDGYTTDAELYRKIIATLAAQAAELEGVRKDAELGRYIRLTAAQRAHGLSEEAFSIRVENAIKRRASLDTAIADSGAGGG